MGIAGLAVLAGVFALGVKTGVTGANMGALGESATVAQERTDLASLKVHLQEGIDGLALKMGLLNAHLIRLNALGKRLTPDGQLEQPRIRF